ncbi:MAG: serine/threonine protein kinase [Myxococcaceae bacterium]|nr:serine/threonine protein kinase [Myxococcaceae bacterium]MCI0671907.1 serine/threonine protein kinase [Myxococcaceae bacterium]
MDTPRPVRTDVRVGQVLGPYRLLRLLGEGSMGRVFQARHMRLGREVALKVLRAEHARNTALVVRFFEEARTVNRISHAHIVEVFDFVEDRDSGHVFCVMELLMGRSLAQRLREGPMPLPLVCHVARQLCSALGAAHAVGVVHRDLKPDNIYLVDRPDGPPDVKVLDFGVAKLLTGPRSVTTLDGTLVGTPLYMSPEQAAGLETDRRADLYAVGNLLYEMLSGQPPFADAAFGQLMVKIITTPAPALRRHTRAGVTIPKVLERLVMRCLQKDAASRPQSVEEVLAVLEGPLGADRTARRAQLRELAAATAGGLGFAGSFVAAALVVAAATRTPEPPAVGWTLQVPASPVPAVTPGGLSALLAGAEHLRSIPLSPGAHSPLPLGEGQGEGKLHPNAGVTVPAVGTRASQGEVLLTVSSVPAGAVVTRADTGEWLGTTPLRRNVPRGSGVLELRVTRPGRIAATQRVALDQSIARVMVSLPLLPDARRAPRSTLRSRDDVLDPFAAP